MPDPNELTWPASDFSRVPFPVYTDEDVYEREQERIFRGPVWLYLALEAEIPSPCDFKTVYAGDTPVVVTRAADGGLHAFVNRCAHKGTMVVREPRGNRSSHTCIYHHWCYDLTGQLIGVPFQHGDHGKGGMPKDFMRSEHGLETLKVACYKGVIFGSFDPGVEPLEDYLDKPAIEFFDRLFAKPIEVLGYARQRLPSNWKAYWENSITDGYHAGLLHQLPVVVGMHRHTQDASFVLDKEGRHVVSYVVTGTDTDDDAVQGYGDTALGAEIEDPVTLADPAFLDWRDEWGDGHTVGVAGIFPGLLIHHLSNTMATRQVRPKRPDEHEMYWTFFGFADDDSELRHMRFQQMGLIGPAGCISMEDGESGVLIQRAVRRAPYSHSVLEMGGTGPIEDQDSMMTEVPTRSFWRYYHNLMGFPAPGG